MVFMREEHGCPEENLGMKAQSTFNQFGGFLSLVLKVFFTYLGEIRVKNLNGREAQILISKVHDRNACNKRRNNGKEI